MDLDCLNPFAIFFHATEKAILVGGPLDGDERTVVPSLREVVFLAHHQQVEACKGFRQHVYLRDRANAPFVYAGIRIVAQE